MSDDRRTPDEGSRGRPGSFESDMDSFDSDEFGGPLFGATTEQPVTSMDHEPAAERISFGADDSGAACGWHWAMSMAMGSKKSSRRPGRDE